MASLLFPVFGKCFSKVMGMCAFLLSAPVLLCILLYCRLSEGMKKCIFPIVMVFRCAEIIFFFLKQLSSHFTSYKLFLGICCSKFKHLTSAPYKCECLLYMSLTPDLYAGFLAENGGSGVL